jgi:hypothetical protein
MHQWPAVNVHAEWQWVHLSLLTLPTLIKLLRASIISHSVQLHHVLAALR